LQIPLPPNARSEIKSSTSSPRFNFLFSILDS
jgi:hypothetical protein